MLLKAYFQKVRRLALTEDLRPQKDLEIGHFQIPPMPPSIDTAMLRIASKDRSKYSHRDIASKRVRPSIQLDYETYSTM